MTTQCNLPSGQNVQKAGPAASPGGLLVARRGCCCEGRSSRGGEVLSRQGVASRRTSRVRLCCRSLPTSAAAVGDDYLPSFLADPEG